jgi:hypothetical protein
MKKTELVAPLKDVSADPRFAVCYGRGSVLRAEGNFLRVESGSRTLAHRALCVLMVHGKKCSECPNHNTTVRLRHGR